MRRRHFVYGTFALVAFIGAAIAQPPSPAPWTMPEVSALPRDARGQLIRDGRDIMLATYAFIGPNVDDPAKRFAGNNLACTNCHLSGGTTKYGLPRTTLMKFLLKVMANLAEPHGGDASDRLITALSKMAPDA